MTSPVNQQLREYITNFFDGLSSPESGYDEPPERRMDGVIEFAKRWCVRGNEMRGVFASISDRDDIIEFGLLERDGDTTSNLLHVSVVFDEELAEVICMSDANSDLNFTTPATPQKQVLLGNALQFFAEGLRDASV